jgi:medium-chain acyl-[acyl-carrier-protein] hydrolase
MFSRWPQYLDRRIEVCPLEYAGRGTRIMEPLYTSMATAVADLFSAWRGQIGGAPYAFFGHSLGAMVVFELMAAIKRARLAPPMHAFFSGRPAPGVPPRDPKKRHLLPEDEFKNELLELGGTASEIMDYPELLDLMLPMIRNDFRIAEEYRCQDRDAVLGCDITILLGDDEDVLPEEADAWRVHTEKRCDIHLFTGGHFFIQSQIAAIAGLINQTLLPGLDGGDGCRAKKPEAGSPHA